MEKSTKTKRTHKKQLRGVVVSDRMDKTIVVAVDRYYKQPLYRKYVRRTKRYKAHDEKNEYKVGDKIIIEESKPISKHKKWVIVGRV